MLRYNQQRISRTCMCYEIRNESRQNQLVAAIFDRLTLCMQQRGRPGWTRQPTPRWAPWSVPQSSPARCWAASGTPSSRTTPPRPSPTAKTSSASPPIFPTNRLPHAGPHTLVLVRLTLSGPAPQRPTFPSAPRLTNLASLRNQLRRDPLHRDLPSVPFRAIACGDHRVLP